MRLGPTNNQLLAFLSDNNERRGKTDVNSSVTETPLNLPTNTKKVNIQDFVQTQKKIMEKQAAETAKKNKNLFLIAGALIIGVLISKK